MVQRKSGGVSISDTPPLFYLFGRNLVLLGHPFFVPKVEGHAEVDVGQVEAELHLRGATRTDLFARVVELLDRGVLNTAQADRYGGAYRRENIDRNTRIEADLELHVLAFGVFRRLARGVDKLAAT